MKGHAKTTDIETGITTKELKEGNCKAVTVAYEGVKMHGTSTLAIGIVLAIWRAEYAHFVFGIQKFITAVLEAEKMQSEPPNKMSQYLLDGRRDATLQYTTH